MPVDPASPTRKEAVVRRTGLAVAAVAVVVLLVLVTRDAPWQLGVLSAFLVALCGGAMVTYHEETP